MRRYLILTFALVLIVVVQVVPQADLMDGDGGFSYAIVSRIHFHPSSSTNKVILSATQCLAALGQPENSRFSIRVARTEYALPANPASVLRC